MPGEKQYLKSEQNREAQEQERSTQKIEHRIDKIQAPADSTDEFPDSRVQMQQHYQNFLESGDVPDGPEGSLRPTQYPEVEITPDGDVYGAHKDLHAFLKSEGLSGPRKDEMVHMEAHHLVKDQYMAPFGFNREEGLSVGIFSHEHMQNAHGKDRGIEFQLPSKAVYDIWDVVDGHVTAYKDIGRPEWAAKVQDYVRANKDRILTAYQDGTVIWAKPEEVRKAERFLNAL